MRIPRNLSWLSLILAVLGLNSAQANIIDTFGIGSRTAALAGAGTAWGFEGYAAANNPAALALATDKRLTLSWGILAMIPNFVEPGRVVIQNEFTGNAAGDPATFGEVLQDYRNTFGQVVGINYQIAPEMGRLTLGVTFFIPFNQIAYMDTGETFLPEYVLHRSRTNRPQFEFGLGAEIAEGFYAGAGIHVGYTMTSKATLFLNNGAGRTSQARLSASLKPKLAPHLGLLYYSDGRIPSPTGPDKTKAGSFSLGMVFRAPVASESDITALSAARVIGNVAALDLNIGMTATQFYDPLTVSLGGSVKYMDTARFIAQADFEAWSDFEPPSITIGQPTINNCGGAGCNGVSFTPSVPPEFTAQNIVVGKLAHELEVSDGVTMRLGYGYRPSIFSRLPTGIGNYLDPDRHMFTGGLGFRFANFLNFATPCNLDFHAAYHLMPTQTVVKTAGNEIGNASDTKIGGPSYDVGGNVAGGGVSLTVAF